MRLVLVCLAIGIFAAVIIAFGTTKPSVQPAAVPETPVVVKEAVVDGVVREPYQMGVAEVAVFILTTPTGEQVVLVVQSGCHHSKCSIVELKDRAAEKSGD